MRETKTDGRPALRASATRTVDRLGAGPIARHVAFHFRTVIDSEVDRFNQLCQMLGPSVVRSLADALAREENAVAIRRLGALLLSFGSAGRRSVEQLKNSPNPAVRRTAITLLRRAGGHEALLELASMLGDADPEVQRESIHAIVEIGTTNAYSVLHRLLLESDTPRDTALRELRQPPRRQGRAALQLRHQQGRATRKAHWHPHLDDRSPRHDETAPGVDSRLAAGAPARPLVGALPNHDAAAGCGDLAAPARNAGSARRARSGSHERWPQRPENRASTGGAVLETGEEHDMSVPPRSRLADELSRRLAGALRGAQLYAPGHPLVTRSARALADTLALVHQTTNSVAIGIVGEELVVGEVPDSTRHRNHGRVDASSPATRHRAHRHRPRCAGGGDRAPRCRHRHGRQRRVDGVPLAVCPTSVWAGWRWRNRCRLRAATSPRSGGCTTMP